MTKFMRMRDDLIIYVDGASSGNPGDAGIGVVIRSLQQKKEEKISKYIGKSTNNFAEYTALIVGLERARFLQAKKIQVRTDSELLTKQISGEYKVKSENLKKLNRLVLDLLTNFHAVDIKHIKREENKEADKLAKKAIIDYKRANQMVAAHDIECGEESPSSAG